MTRIKLLFIAMLAIGYTATAQPVDLQTACASAMQGKAGNFIISYTIGELVLVDSWKENGLWITQGVHQPTGIVRDKEGNSNDFASGEIMVFPNPTPMLLSIQASLLHRGKIKMQLYNSLGQLLINQTNEYHSFTTYRYNLVAYSAGPYRLLITFAGEDGTNRKGVYTIIKHN